MEPELVEFTQDDKVPQRINRQLLCMNFGSGGYMKEIYCNRIRHQAKIFCLLDGDKVLAWATLSLSPIKPLREAHFFTRVSERKKGYYKRLKSHIDSIQHQYITY